jgi:hypothetical protein
MGWFSALMERRALRAWAIIAVVGAMAAVLLIGMQAAFASHPEVSLPGSDFEIDTDANLKVDDPAPSIDWASVPQGGSAIGNEVRQADEPTGQTDDSFGQGTKEDTAVPTVVDGGIPNNKSDLVTFGVTLEENASGRFMHMYWHRVQEPVGTTNMDFEFNQSETPSANGVTPVRTAGDLLIQYDLAQGGTNPQLFLSEWVATGNKSLCEAANSTPCWGDRVNLTAAGDATGSINTSPIPAAESDGLGDISPRTFGEATVDFDALAGDDPCVGFGSAYLKSRASDSFTAALKDFIAPTALNIDQCGAIQVTKTAKHKDSGTSPNLGATFTVKQGTTTVGTITTDPATGKGCLGNLQLGTYTVSETSGPSGYKLDTDTETANVTTTGSCSSGFVNVSFENVPLTNITVSVDSQVPGGTNSTIDCEPPVGDPPPTPTAANGDGSLTLNNKEPGTYTCTVVVDP